MRIFIGKVYFDIFGFKWYYVRHVKNERTITLDNIKGILRKLDNKPMLQVLVLSLITLLIVESLGRRHFLGGFYLICCNPIMFIYNWALVYVTYTIALFVKRRYYVYLLIAVIWVGLGIINFVVLSFRTTPITGVDFYIIFFVSSIIKVYMTTIQIILVVLVSTFVITTLVLIRKRFERTSIQFKKGIIIMLSMICFLIGIHSIALSTGSLKEDFSELADAFKEYGFVYCFSNSVVSRGIKRPESYSTESVSIVMENAASQDVSDFTDDFEKIPETNGQLVDTSISVNETVVNPNVIYLQLESFIDMDRLINFGYSETITPHYNALKDEYPSGLLTVPTIGAGTVNTEFEILTGMSLQFFGVGEYPYNTIIQQMPVESICHTLKTHGYHTHGIHNNTGVFYSRHLVYPMLGFDSFSPIEYMQDLEYNPLGWTDDSVIATEIIKELNHTEEQDYIFITTMQSHGKYPDTVIDETQEITMEVISEDYIISEGLHCAYEYFMNQLNKTDEFVGELINYLEDFQEPTVLVMYGDHFPALEIENEQLAYGSKFQTEYIIWSNYGLEAPDQDIYAYQMSSYIMDLIGFDNGVMNVFHKTYADDEDYLEEMKLLQYDMLYGDMNVFDGINPYEPTAMTFGVQPILVSGVEVTGEMVQVLGTGFTESSQIFINDQMVESYFINGNTLMIPLENFIGVERLHVGQVSDLSIVLSTSNIYVLDSKLESHLSPQ